MPATDAAAARVWEEDPAACGMITTAGIRLLSSGKKYGAYILTTDVSLVAALTLPLRRGAAEREPGLTSTGLSAAAALRLEVMRSAKARS